MWYGNRVDNLVFHFDSHLQHIFREACSKLCGFEKDRKTERKIGETINDDGNDNDKKKRKKGNNETQLANT